MIRMALLEERRPPTYERLDTMKLSSVYEIRVRGYLEEEWGDWFDGMSITHMDKGETTLTGPVVDQPALFGLLLRVNSLNLTLLSVNVISFDQNT